MSEIWMKLSRDKYEFPIEMADSIEELAAKCGIKVSTIRETICRYKNAGRRPKYIKVEVDDVHL